MYRRGTGPGARSGRLELGRDLWRRARAAVWSSPGLALLSALLAVALWVTVTEEQNPTLIETFPVPLRVEAVNVGPGIAVANTIESVEVRIAAPEDRWEQLTSENFQAVADLNGLEAREQHVPVEVDVTGVRSVRVVEVIPSTVLVNLEDFVSKEVAVVARAVGSLPLGYELASTTPEAAAVEVSGPQSLVELVVEVIGDVNVTGLTVSLPQSVDLTPQGAGGGEVRGVLVNPPSTRIRVEVLQTTLTRHVPLIPTVLGEPAGGYRVVGVTASPSTLAVRGTIDQLQAIDALELPPVDIAAARSSLRRSVVPDLPPGLTAPGGQPVSVLVAVATVDGTLRLQVAPEVEGVPPGYAAELDRQRVEVLLRAPQPALNGLSVTDVRVVADLAGVETGTGTGTGAGAGPGPGPGVGPAWMRGTGTETGAGAGPGARPGVDGGTGTETGAGTDADGSTEEGTEAGTEADGERPEVAFEVTPRAEAPAGITVISVRPEVLSGRLTPDE